MKHRTSPKQLPLIVIVGPTAVGKTRLSLRLAQDLDGEIVSADSRQVYRGMDIGTAKPTLEERRCVPHHLIDVVAPDESFTLAQYQELAYDAIGNVLARSQFPFLVGGTGQYVKAVVEGWGIPRVPPNAELRAELYRQAEVEGEAALHARPAGGWTRPLPSELIPATCGGWFAPWRSTWRPGSPSPSCSAKNRRPTASCKSA